MLTTKTLLLNSIVVQQPGNLVTNMDGEKVMLSVQNGKYYNLGEIGGLIWDLANEPIEVNKMIETILLQYEVNLEDCTNHILDFLESLKNEDLIKLAD
jgi:hypothetical protein